MGLCKGSAQMGEEMLRALGDGFIEVSLEVKLSRRLQVVQLGHGISGLDGQQNEFTWLLIGHLQNKVV